MPKINYENQVLDARPGRLDFRDREYRPHLESLPARFPEDDSYMEAYAKSGLIMNQGEEGKPYKTVISNFNRVFQTNLFSHLEPLLISQK